MLREIAHLQELEAQRQFSQELRARMAGEDSHRKQQEQQRDAEMSEQEQRLKGQQEMLKRQQAGGPSGLVCVELLAMHVVLRLRAIERWDGIQLRASPR